MQNLHAWSKFTKHGENLLKVQLNKILRKSYSPEKALTNFSSEFILYFNLHDICYKSMLIWKTLNVINNLKKNFD